MAADSGATSVNWWNQPAKNMISSCSKPSSSSSEPENRKKRCRICRQATLQWLASDDQTKTLSLGDETPLVGINTFAQGSESKGSPNVVKNYDQPQRKRVSGIRRSLTNAGSVASSVNNLGPGCMLPHLAAKDVRNERGNGQKFGDISKEIDDAISRIESLIPSLQKLVNAVHTPNKRGDGDSRCKVRNLPAQDENLLSKQVSQMLRKSNDPAPLSVNQSQNACYVRDDLLQEVAFLKREGNSKMDDIELLNETMARTLAIKPLSFITQRSQVPDLKAKATMDRLMSLKNPARRAKSVASQTPEFIQGLRIMPCRSHMEKPSQSQNNTRRDIVKGAALRPDRVDNLGELDRNWISSHTGGRSMLERHAPSHSNRKNIDGASRSKASQDFHDSEETSWGSPTSSTGVSPGSGSYPSSSRTYETSSESSESEMLHGEDDCIRGYGDLSSYSSEDRDSDVSHSSQSSATRRYRRDRHFEQVKAAGRFKRFKNKLGKIFHHHHHHHHHHYNDDDEGGYVRSFWRRLGAMFHHTRKRDNREKPKADKLKKSVIKSMPNKKQHGGHFHALFEGLISHLKHSKKPKDDITRLRNSLHGSIKKTVGVKVPNRGRVKLVSRTKRPSLAAPKRISRQ